MDTVIPVLDYFMVVSVFVCVCVCVLARARCVRGIDTYENVFAWKVQFEGAASSQSEGSDVFPSWLASRKKTWPEQLCSISFKQIVSTGEYYCFVCYMFSS